MQTKTCKHCCYKWVSNIDHPKACPKCRTKYWDTKPTKRQLALSRNAKARWLARKTVV